MIANDYVKWELEFAFRKKKNSDLFVKKVLKLPYSAVFSYTHFTDNTNDHWYQINIQGNGAKLLNKATKFITKIELMELTDDD